MEKSAVLPTKPPSFATVRHSAVTDTLMALLGDIRYGSIEVTIHDGTVVQIERKEKMRV